MGKLTREEEFKIILAAQAADDRGDSEEARRLNRMLPLPLHLAQFLKEEFGPQYLLDGGYNLSEIEEQYGKDWISR